MPPSILIVDDRAINLEFLGTLLGYAGYRVLETANGALALDMARREQPALIISDVLMPGMDGIELANRLHADPMTAHIPLIFYTATYRLSEALRLAQTCGVDIVLAKPAEPQAILDAVAKALKSDADARLKPTTKRQRAFLSAGAPSANLPELAGLQRRLQNAFQEEIGPEAEPDSSRQRPDQSVPGLDKVRSLSLRLAALLDLSLVLSSERDPQQLLELFCRAAQDIMNVKCAAISMRGCKDKEFNRFAWHGMGDDEAAAIAAALDSLTGKSGKVPEAKKTRRPRECDNGERVRPSAPLHPLHRDSLLAPVTLGTQACGWLYLADKLGTGAFDEEDEQFALTLVAQVAPLYENLILYDEAKQHAGQLELESLERKRMFEKLQESESQFRQIAENIHEVFFLIDGRNTRVFYISPAYEEIWGRSCESLYANPQSWMDSVHSDDMEAVTKGNAERNEKGRFDYAYRIVRPDRSIRWIRARGFPVSGNDDGIVRVAGFAEDITEQMHMQTALRDRDAGLSRAQLMTKLAHVITEPDGKFESWSETLPQLIGVDAAGMPPTTRKWLDLVHQADRGKFRDACIEAGKSGVRVEVEYRLWRADGVLIDLRQVLEPLQGYLTPDGKMRWFNTIQDVTEHNAQLQRIARLSRIYAVLSAINSAIVRIHDRNELFQEACRVAVRDGTFGMAWIGVIDPETLDGRVVAWFGGEPGYVEKIRLTKRPDCPDSDRPACVAVREMRPVICNNIEADPTMASHKAELLARGHRSVAALPLIVENQAVGVIALFAEEADFFDELELRLLDELAGDLSFALQFIGKEEQLSYLAYYDVLTALPNGRLFQDRLTQFLHANKPDQRVVAVILINLDRFAQTNDALGRHAGDALLKQIARRLGASLQEPYSLARISGDTFAIAIPDLQQAADAAAILAQQIFAPLAPPFVLNQQEIRISVRAGLALYPGDGADAEALFKHAEVALKNAKTSGERYLYYASKMNTALAARIVLENELLQALEADQFVIYFQPRVDLPSGRIVGAEALIRWQHPQRGMIPPMEFIPLAEQTGLIVQIGAWVIDTVCAQQAAWLKQQVAIVPVAINLSAIQFKNGQVLQTIRDAIQVHQLEQRHIEFELTESVVMENPEEATHNLEALKTLGMLLSLDDFGTGYSSLAYLKRFPFDFVKIDRTFITDITNNPGDAAIATAVIAMAHSLNLRVVAEGVETEGQLQFLRRLQCDEIQGYYFSRPLPADAFEAMLREDTRLACAHELTDTVDTLLLVDDEPHVLATLSRLLRREGYRVLTASCGQEGLDLLAVNAVQVIVTDQRMPGMAGSEFLSIVKGLYPDTIRIILSGYTDLAAITDSVNRGAVFKFLTKPWDDVLLRENIRDAFRRYRPAA